MKPDLSLYKKDFLSVVGELPEDALAKINEIFDDLEAEVGFLDERRQDAEDSLRTFIEALALQKKSQEENANSQELFNAS
jgi:hypothetical protein